MLRDSLWSQQDHPTAHKPLQLMLPPSWILIAAARPSTLPVTAYPVQDDAQWSALADQGALFGGYPSSTRLFALATSNLSEAEGEVQARIVNARSSLQQLRQLTGRLQEVSPQGSHSVVTRGAELIAEGDRRYFGAEIRRNRIIPILVENPNAQEVLEGKGPLAPGLETSVELENFLVSEICRLRLLDGDIALERYDLSNPVEVNRALELLQRIIPRGEPGSTRVWLWVTGKLLPGKTLQGEGALAYAETFWNSVRNLPINTDRLLLLNKPVEVPGPDFTGRLEAYDRSSLHLSIDAGIERLRSMQ